MQDATSLPMAAHDEVTDDLDLDLFYNPRSIVVVGAHEQRQALARTTTIAMAKAKATGAAFYAVNPKFDTIFGAPCFPSLGDVPGEVDLLIILTGDPAAVLADSASKRPRFALVFANGFSEQGTEEGRRRDADLIAAGRAAGLRIIGPNTNANALETFDDLPGPKLSLVTQSGHQGRPIFQAQELGVALRYMAPTGNELDVESSQFMRFFAEDPETAVICGYIEGFVSGQRLREAAIAAVEHGTPIVLVKVGRSAEGAAMAVSHTAHMVGSDRGYDAFFEQYGITRVDDLDELLEVAVALSRSNVPEADGVLVSSTSGGTSAHLADLVGVAGLSMPKLADETVAELSTMIPAGFEIRNPLDNGGVAISGPDGNRLVEVALADPSIGLIIMPVTGVTPLMTEGIVASLINARQVSRKPVLCIWSGPTISHPGHREMFDAHVPVFRNFRNAVRAAKALLDHPSRNPEVQEVVRLAKDLPPIEPWSGDLQTLDEASSTAWLAERGIPFADNRTAATADEAGALAAEMGFPVVVKGLGAAHKSEHGLVKLDLTDADAVQQAASEVLASGCDAVLVAPFVSGGLELLVGMSTDPVLGPLIAVGAGGVTAEALGDVQVSVLPVTEARARVMLRRLRVAPLLAGWRGAAPLDVDAAAGVIMRLAEIAATGEAQEIDINPLTVLPSGVLGLDALVRLRRPSGGDYEREIR